MRYFHFRMNFFIFNNKHAFLFLNIQEHRREVAKTKYVRYNVSTSSREKYKQFAEICNENLKNRIEQYRKM